jgi:hypothetical protein
MTALIEALAAVIESALPWRLFLGECPFPPAIITSMIDQEADDAAA